MAQWTQLAEGVFVARYQPLDISIGLVLGGEGRALLVDTRCNPREARELAAEIADVFSVTVTDVVNTHAHYDHAFGNQVFASTARIHGHANIPAHFDQFERPRLQAWTANPSGAPQYDWTDVVLTAPTELVDAEQGIDLGGRSIELVPLPPGHTDTDLAVHVPDAGVWFVGDVVEESGPPMYGSGAYPLSWPAVLDSLALRLADAAVVVPGHGAVVDAAFIRSQAGTLGIVADTIRDGFEHHEPLEYVAERASQRTALPLEIVEAAVVRGYSQLSG
ncbi:MBL fold metallo-hydrolase [Rathayibacter sp. YIM 133350]|uniref:MBL fold metallo-hydrolase n=1 Tax=Rathayibacter sp. YIM 133350 TaxID=3131992 RepID=UPI00307EFE63